MQTTPVREQRTRIIGLAISLVSAIATLVAWAAPNPPWQIPSLFLQDVQLIHMSPIISLLILAFPVTAVLVCIASGIEALGIRLRVVRVIHLVAIFICAGAIVCYALGLGFLQVLALLFGRGNTTIIPLNYSACILIPCVAGIAIGLAMSADRQAQPRFRGNRLI